MNELHQKLLRALIAAQVAVLEHADEDVMATTAIKGVDDCVKQIVKLANLLKKSDSE